MAIFKLKKESNSIENAVLVSASKTNLELEKHLENWLENSPWAIAQEPLLIIGRQTTAVTNEYGAIFPDLLGIDKEGNLVIIELKKGRTPREVIVQLLEYAAWANELSDSKIYDLSASYFSTIDMGKDIETLFLETFETDEFPELNQRLRLFIAAEEISPSVAKVCRFLRQVHGVDVNCVQFSIFQTESGEILINSESFVGHEDIVAPKKITESHRWMGEKPVKQVVWESVQQITQGDTKKIFSPRDVCQVILQKYPNFNKNTVNCQIISDSVNHTSRHYYPGGEDRYWWEGRGRYKLFDPITDK